MFLKKFLDQIKAHRAQWIRRREVSRQKVHARFFTVSGVDIEDLTPRIRSKERPRRLLLELHRLPGEYPYTRVHHTLYRTKLDDAPVAGWGPASDERALPLYSEGRRHRLSTAFDLPTLMVTIPTTCALLAKSASAASPWTPWPTWSHFRWYQPREVPLR